MLKEKLNSKISLNDPKPIIVIGVVLTLISIFNYIAMGQDKRSPIYEMIKNNDPDLKTVPGAELNYGQPSLIKGNELFFSDNIILLEENDAFKTTDEIVYKRLDRAFIEETDSSWTKRSIACNETNCEIITSIR